MKIKMRILDTAYNSKGDHATVEIYGITPEGEKTVAVDSNFFSYMYILYDENIMQQLLCNRDVLSCTVTALEHNQELIKVIKAYVRYPWIVPQIRKQFPGAQFFSADINFGLRYIYDYNLGDCVEVEGKEIATTRYVARRVMNIESIETCDPFDVPLKIMSFDIENARDGHILCLCAATLDEGGNILSEERLAKGGETGIIQGFLNYFQSEEPDVITGYFINGYDFPMLEKKCAEYGLYPETHNLLPLSSNKSGIRVKAKNARSVGVIVADAHYWARREFKPKKETLNFVADLLLGEQKDDVDRTDMDGEWARDKERVIEYCLKDAVLAGRVLVETKALKKGKDHATVNNLPLSDIMADHQSYRTDSFLVRRADRQGIAVPMNRHLTEEERKNKKKKKITGGYVKEMPDGVFEMIICLDFKGMYPSMIINNNLCFTTYDPENGTIESPVGAKFLAPEIREGIIPQEMRRLGAQRDTYKRMRDEAKSSGDTEVYGYYNGLQDAVKITMNSFYGVLASDFYRFTNKAIGGSITGFARENTKRVINGLNEEGFFVLYSDTDSVFFQVKDNDRTIEKAVEVGKDVAKRYTRGNAELEFEKLMDPFFTIGKKKKYFGKIIWPEESEITRGFQNRRGDSFDFLSETLDNIFKFIGQKKNKEALDYVKSRLLLLSKQDVPKVDLVTSKTVKDEGEYIIPERLASVRAARKLRDLGLVVPPNTKVDWIVTDGDVSPQAVEPYHPSLDNNMDPDWNYYKERFIMTMSNITAVLGMKELELRTGQRQMSICDY